MGNIKKDLQDFIKIAKVESILKKNDLAKIKEYFDSIKAEDEYIESIIQYLIKEKRTDIIKVMLESNIELNIVNLLYLSAYISMFFCKPNDSELLNLLFAKIKEPLGPKHIEHAHYYIKKESAADQINTELKKYISFLITDKNIKLNDEAIYSIFNIAYKTGDFDLFKFLMNSEKFIINKEKTTIDELKYIFTEDIRPSASDKGSLKNNRLKIFFQLLFLTDIKTRTAFFTEKNYKGIKVDPLFKDLLCLDLKDLKEDKETKNKIKKFSHLKENKNIQNDTIKFSNLIQNIKDNKDIDTSVKNAFFTEFEKSPEYGVYLKYIWLFNKTLTKDESFLNSSVKISELNDIFKFHIKDFLFASTKQQNNSNTSNNEDPSAKNDKKSKPE